MSADGPLLRARELAEWLGPRAVELERDGVTRAVLDRFAAGGLHALEGPPELGGQPVAVRREIGALLAGASPDAAFVFAQHASLVRQVRDAPHAAGLLPDLCAGRLQGGQAFSNVRSARPVLATRTASGWRLRGTQPWVSGWGLLDRLLVGARTAAGQVLFCLAEPGAPGLRASPPLALAAMGGTRTVALEVDLAVPDADVLGLHEAADWEAGDRLRSREVQPAALGIASAALDLLAEADPAAATRLGERLERIRDAAAGDPPPDPGLRVAAVAFALRCATAAVASRGGRGMAATDRSQLLARAALFQLVQAQTAEIRARTLTSLSRPGEPEQGW